MKTTLLSPRLVKMKKDKTNKSGHLLDDLSKFETSEFVGPNTTRHKLKKKRKINKSTNIFEDSSQLFKTTSPYAKRLLSPKRQFNCENSLKDLDKSKKLRKKIRKKNLVLTKTSEFKHPLPWGADQRIIKSKKKLSGDEDTKSRIKTDRDTSRRALRKEIGLDLYPNVKVRIKVGNKSEDKPKTKRSPDPALQSYMRRKKKNERLAKLRGKIEENLREKERVKALANLEKTLNKKVKKKRKRKGKSVGNDEDKTINPVTRKGKYKELRGNGYRNVEFYEYAGNIREIVKIQRWIRRVLSKIRKDERDSQAFFENFAVSLKNNDFFSMSKTSVPEMSGQESNVPEIIEELVSKQPKKVAKIPMLCITSILQSKNSSFDESEKVKQFNGFGLKQEKEFEELYERFENFNIDTLNSFCSEVQDISVIGKPTMLFNKNQVKGDEEEEDDDEEEEEKEDFEGDRERDELFEENCREEGEIFEEDSDKIEVCGGGFRENYEDNESFNEIKIISRENDLGSSENSLNSFQESPEKNSGGSESSNYQEAEDYLKQILERHSSFPSEPLSSLYRPGMLINDRSDSSEEEWNSKNIILYTDTTISEQALETLEYKQRYFLTDYENQLQSLIKEEIEAFIESVKFNERLREVDPSCDFINKLLGQVFKELEKKEENFLALMNSPILFDPISKLKFLQVAGKGELSKPLQLKEILSSHIKSRFELNCNLTACQKIYTQMVFACANEAFNTLLPFGVKGYPDPWSSLSPLFTPKTELSEIFGESFVVISKWVNVNNGKYLEGLINDQDTIDKIREERLNLILSEYIKEYEATWVQYEDEETQIKLDLSEIILDDLFTETCVGLLS